MSSKQRTLSAHSISKTVADSLSDAPFQGRVLSCFSIACNLIDDADRVVSLVTVGVGDGPLNVVLEGEEPFAGIETGARAQIDREKAVVGQGLAVDLKKAKTWDPTLIWGTVTPEAMATLWDHMQGKANPESLLTIWVPLIRPMRGVRMAYHETARATAGRLLLALNRGDRVNIAASTTVLAGLGPGTTPAGDDFLVGLMAGLRAWPEFLSRGGLSADDACTLIGQTATFRSHVLCSAYLRAAQAGQMSAGWHRLAAALMDGNETAIRKAANDSLAFGATSGADAMAGFVGPYLLTGPGEVNT